MDPMPGHTYKIWSDRVSQCGSSGWNCSLGWPWTSWWFSCSSPWLRSYKTVPTLPGFLLKSHKNFKVIAFCVCNHHTHGGKRTTLGELVISTLWPPRISRRLSGLVAALSPSELSCQPLLWPFLSYCLFPAGIGGRRDSSHIVSKGWMQFSRLFESFSLLCIHLY